MTALERHERLSFAGFPLDLPGKFTEFHPWQLGAIDEAIEQFRAGMRVVMIDAPTGAGKTLIGESIAQLVSQWHRWTPHENRLYLCTSLPLQAQFVGDFPAAALIKGRSNYPTLDAGDGWPEVHAGDCTKTLVEVVGGRAELCPRCDTEDCSVRLVEDPPPKRVTHCHQCHPWEFCPYEVAKGRALSSQLTVANTAYLLAEANSVGRFGEQPDGVGTFGVTVVDEADTLEDVLMGYVELAVGARSVARLGIGTPKKTVATSWLEWLTEAEFRSRQMVVGYAQELATLQTLQKDPPTRLLRDLDQWTRLRDQIVAVKRRIEEDPDGWVYQEQGSSLSMRPIRVDRFGEEMIWRHSERWLLMSATLISPAQVARDLGIEDGTWGSVSVDSPFPVERRPVIVRPVADMSYSSKDAERPYLHEAVDEILTQHPGDRVLIHTVSYELAERLLQFLSLTAHAHRTLTYTTARDRDEVLERYRRTPGAVLVAPSLERGVDLPNEECRVVVVCKVPYPALGDKQVSTRLHGTQDGRSWYLTRTIRSLVQMTGRGMRHANDQCTSYILDKAFLKLWSDGLARALVPRWWKDALVWEGPRQRE